MAVNEMLGKKLETQGVVAIAVASFKILSGKNQKKYVIFVVAQMLTSLLDIAGVAVIGIIGTLVATNSDDASQRPAALTPVLEFFHMENIQTERLVMLLALVAALFFLSKGVISLSLVRIQVNLLQKWQHTLGSKWMTELMWTPLHKVLSRSSQETAYAITSGSVSISVGILGSASLILSEFSLLLFMLLALAIVDLPLTLGTIAIFLTTSVTLHTLIGRASAKAGRVFGEAQMTGYEAVQTSVSSYREVTVGNRRKYFIDKVGSQLILIGQAQAKSTWLQQIPRYVYENVLILGAILLASVQFLYSDSSQALVTLAVFLVAGSRLMPSILRIQNALISIKSSAGMAKPAFELAAELSKTDISSLSIKKAIRPGDEDILNIADGFEATVVVSDLHYSYPETSLKVLVDVSFKISSGSTIAITGSTGSGKSTLVDLILGLRDPSQGKILVNNQTPQHTLQTWPGAIAYVPQNCAMISGSIRENVLFGLDSQSYSDEQIWWALEKAHLAKTLSEGRGDLDTIVGENAQFLSGGQRQRLGIARALLTDPKLLILDEATSSLDAETEKAVGETISELRGSVTTITVAHRLATVMNSDMIIYLENGRATVGDFDSVKSNAPLFARQAEILGL